MTQTVLILGANGRFGSHAATAFATAGWRVRRFDRAADDLETAMQGADVVVSAWNPPGYHLWNEALAESHAAVAAAAARSGATVILPGNVYVYGPDAPAPWRADTPHRATNPLGLFRKRIEAAYRSSGARTLILRCGDFIDTHPTGNWFEGYITPSVPKGFIRYPGNPDAPHAWAYLPDAARAAVALADNRAQLARFEDVPFPGYTLSGHDIADAISRVTGRGIAVKPFQWNLMRLARPFMPLLRGVFEMRYLWSLPQRLDGARLAQLAPDFTPTAAEDALRDALAYQAAPAAKAA
ncbi:epimerase [Sinisalibacter aestuarii]|uniref:Membrane protein n=1 Tax=Sinisalibacter aestuarii TaxID=2949426 RepID=A0ABQ5LQJ9_9RHOB|nr:epimerase [Sinisalibacter aestuarii]GKY86347.1 membrane protein [Sinisalibacter aestuarii]